MIAGFLIGHLGYARTFDVLAAVITLVALGVAAILREVKPGAAYREQA